MVERAHSWSDEEIIRLIQLIDQQRSLQDILGALPRSETEIKAQARELALLLPKEFETRFFFRQCK